MKVTFEAALARRVHRRFDEPLSPSAINRPRQINDIQTMPPTKVELSDAPSANMRQHNGWRTRRDRDTPPVTKDKDIRQGGLSSPRADTEVFSRHYSTLLQKLKSRRILLLPRSNPIWSQCEILSHALYVISYCTSHSRYNVVIHTVTP